MIDLDEFLLARLDEMEQVAARWPDNGPAGPPPTGQSFWIDAHGHPIYAPKTFVLADIAAKRRIVEDALADVRDARRRPGWTILDTEVDEKGRDYRVGYENAKAQMLPEALDRTDRLLRLLALPYADHPDYREEWMMPA